MKTSQRTKSLEDKAIQRIYRDLDLFQAELKKCQRDSHFLNEKLDEITHLTDELMNELITYYDFED